jgi:hypothetical protein
LELVTPLASVAVIT